MKTFKTYYYKLFKKALENGNIIIFVIVFLIVLTGTTLNNNMNVFYANANLSKTSNF